MSKNRPRFQYVHEVISDLFGKFPHLHVAPINVHSLAKSLHMDIIEKNYENEMDAAALHHNGRRLILVNNSQSANRKRFSIAHEIGHHLLHSDPLNVDIEIHHRDIKSSQGTDVKEVEANCFAASILMPERLLRSIIASGGIKNFSDEVIESLASKFQVSSQAMTIRLGSLGFL